MRLVDKALIVVTCLVVLGFAKASSGVGYGTSNGQMGPLADRAVTTTDGERWLDTYAPGQTITIHAPWYEDKFGNIVINPGYFESTYSADWGVDHAYDDASVTCRHSLYDAPSDSYVICIKPRPDRPKNEPTPPPVVPPAVGPGPHTPTISGPRRR